MEKIEAVNTVLNAIGEAPINSLEDTSNVDVSIILEMIKRNIRDVLLDGYDFNKLVQFFDAVQSDSVFSYMKRTKDTIYRLIH